MARYLITGASGFIGTALCRALRERGDEVFGIDIEEGDLRMPGVFDAWCRTIKPDVVVHLAAQVGRLRGEVDLEFSISENALMTAIVARSAEEHGARLVYTSTSEIYGNMHGEVAHEDYPLKSMSHNLYGLTKFWGEQVAAMYAPDGLQVMRLSMPYGPGIDPGWGKNALINFLWWANTQQSIVVHEGSARSWTWIGDTIHGMLAVMDLGERAESVEQWMRGVGVYNVGRNDDMRSMEAVAHVAYDVIEREAGMTGLQRKVEVVPVPAHTSAEKSLSDYKLRSLGWEPVVDLDEGMLLTYQHVRRFDKDGREGSHIGGDPIMLT